MQRLTRTVLLPGVLVLALACQSMGDILATPTPVASATPSYTPTPKKTPTRTPTPTATPLVIQAGTVRKMTSGGFSYAPLEGFDLEANNYQVFMDSPDGNIHIMLSGEAPFPGELLSVSRDNIVDYMQEQFGHLVEGPREKFELQGAKGITILLSGGEELTSRVALVQPRNGKQLYILSAPLSRVPGKPMGNRSIRRFSRISPFSPSSRWLIALWPKIGIMAIRSICPSMWAAGLPLVRSASASI